MPPATSQRPGGGSNLEKRSDTMSIPPSEHASLIIAHYLRALTERAGLRWTAQNDQDMETLADLLGACEEAQDSIPPYEWPVVSDRQTIVFDRDEPPADYGDPNFARWRGRHYREDDDVRRLVRR
jgi:hypothetical protein